VALTFFLDAFHVESQNTLFLTHSRNFMSQTAKTQQELEEQLASERESDPEKLPMVGWYDPRQLAQTAVEVAISTIFGRHSDQRLVEAMASGDRKEPDYYDYTHFYTDDGNEICKPDLDRPRDSIWIDYVGDVGDGWNSTYAVAYYLIGNHSFKYSDGKNTFDSTETKRGEVLIFGGDEVYPTASREVYNERLLTPYEAATRTRKESSPRDKTTRRRKKSYAPGPYPHVFAIPGNHDWYDSLVAFTRLFTSNRWFAGWRTRQSRSYFALKLPHNWWLLGTDVQLGSDVDRPQVAYFAQLRKHMAEAATKTGEPATIILCHAEPHWIRAWQYEGIDPNYSESNLRLLEKRLGKNVAVFIAGDLHHYRRHEALDKSTQKITAGGGGAFLHPTHPGLQGKKFDIIFEREEGDENLTLKDVGTIPKDRVFKLKGCFPSTSDSQRATFGNLKFPFFWAMGNASWSLGLITAGLYLLLMFPIVLAAGDPAIGCPTCSFSTITFHAIGRLLYNPLSMLLITVTIVGFWLFTDSHSKVQRFIGGFLHAVAHLVSAFLIAVGSILLVAYISTEKWVLHLHWFGGSNVFPLDTRKLLAILLVLIGGFLAGTFIMGVYVLISLNIFGRHGNEAFSSLGIEDWKNFLRLHIEPNGNLTIYPIGIRRVPRKWKRSNTADGPEFLPDTKADPKATPPELIEEPIFMMKATGTVTGVKLKEKEKDVQA
jgi:hypothetical protein